MSDLGATLIGVLGTLSGGAMAHYYNRKAERERRSYEEHVRL